MPHSSGGGSHGGGFHGGYSSSSHGSSYNGPRYSRRPFVGGIPYVYYVGHTPRIIYTDKDPSTQKHKTSIFAYIFLGVFALIPLGIIMLDGFHNPTKLSLPTNHTIYIDDSNDVLTNAEEDELMSVFAKFQHESGITPVLVTLSNSDWKWSLEDVAYDYYVENWGDEKHWLLMYSSTTGTQKDRYYFEGMQGDDTDGILYEAVTDKFNSTLQSNLRSDTYTVGEAIIGAYNSILPTLMDQTFIVDPGLIFFSVFWDGIVIFMLAAMIVNDIRSKGMKDAVKVENVDSLQMKKCPSCGTSYYEGTIACCHKCGRPLRDDLDF